MRPAHLGSPWRMPTDAEFSALISNCTTTWITTNGVAGRLVTGKGDYADRSIFLPAAGNGNASYLTSAGSVGLYGSSTPFSGYSDSACNLFSNSDAFLKTNGYRSYGLSVRPVKSIATIDITWLNDDGTEIDMTIVSSNAVPSHAEPTKEASAPYRWVFTGWTPELEAAVGNTTYMATFQKIADLALVTEDWTAANGDAIVLTNATDYAVTIPAGASVTINGVTVKGAGSGGAAVDAPSFSDSGESAVTKFAQVSGNKWTVTAFAEMEGDSIGSAVTDGQIKVYAADSVEGLKTAEPLASGVEVEERKSAVKTKINVTLPSTPEKQFFKVTFGD